MFLQGIGGTLSSIDSLSVYRSQNGHWSNSLSPVAYYGGVRGPGRGHTGVRNSLAPRTQPQPAGNGSGLGLPRGSPARGLHDATCQFLEQISSVCLSLRVSLRMWPAIYMLVLLLWRAPYRQRSPETNVSYRIPPEKSPQHAATKRYDCEAAGTGIFFWRPRLSPLSSSSTVTHDHAGSQCTPPGGCSDVCSFIPAPCSVCATGQAC